MKNGVRIAILIILAHAIYYVWVVSVRSQIEPSDLVAVFPGPQKERIREGYELAGSEVASRFTVTNMAGKDIARALGEATGDRRVEFVASEPSRTTFEDALALRKLVRDKKYKSVVLVTSSYHLPRALCLTKILFFGTEVNIQWFGVPLSGQEGSRALSHLKLYINEFFKFWLSLFEMLGYFLTEGPVIDNPLLWKIRVFIRSRMIFTV